MIIKRNTIDFDYYRRYGFDNALFNRMLEKIMWCKHLLYIGVKPSLNGWHVTMLCDTDCDICRLVFDDPVRYAKDLMRPEYSRNVLFTRKEVKRWLVKR